MTIDTPLVSLNGRGNDAPATRDVGYAAPATAATIAALQRTILGDHAELHHQIRAFVRDVGDQPLLDSTYAEETRRAPGFLRKFLADSGYRAREVSADPQVRGALCDAAQVLAPRLLLILTGHFDLAVGAILGLGNGSDYQQKCQTELDTGEALGVLMLTELAGTNGADQQTTAVWDADADCFVLSSRTAKFMPNVADRNEAKTVVVTARLVVDGRDEGVLPFLVRLRERRPSWLRRVVQRALPFLDLRPTPVLANGVRITTLPDKTSAPMDHALIQFDRVLLPRDALLGGDWAYFDAEGRFHCDVPVRARFHKAIAVLGEGRLDLANAAAASARAGLAGLLNYARQRSSGKGVVMSDRDAVQRDIVQALATVYATSVFGRQVRDMRAADDADDSQQALLAMIAKPLMSNAARDALTMVRERTAAQGALRVNHIVDWLGNLEAIITAEGENQIMQVTAGKKNLSELELRGTPEVLPWYIRMLHQRAVGISELGGNHPASLASGPDSVAIELSEATGHLLASTALYIEAQKADDPKARELLEAVCAAYALQTVYANSAWYIDHDDYPRVVGELRRCRGVLLENLQTMVDGFDVPALDAPIFGNYLEWWERYSA